MTADTSPIRSEERFDEERVADYLRAHVPDRFGAGPIIFEQFPGGRANLTYLARSGDVEMVLRRPPLGPVAPGSHDMRREHMVLEALHAAFPEAPRSHHLCEDESVMGKPFFVMERRTGWVVRDRWPDALPSDDGFLATVGTSAVQTLARLHTVDYEALGLGDLGRPSGFMDRQVSGWADRWQRSFDTPNADMDSLGERYPALVPQPQRSALIHNDYKIDNLMIGPDGAVVAVFDWDMATLGDPLVDLGAALAYWVEPGDPAYGVVGSGSGEIAAVIGRDDVVDIYANATGLDVSRVAFYHSFALYRVAIIVQQIYIRYLRGQTTDERFSVLGAIVPLLACEAVEVLDG